jgi:phosphoglycolate phosphatase
MNLIDSVIFDLDGTLWDATDLIYRAWENVLKDRMEIKEPVTLEMLRSVQGLQAAEIGAKLFPYLSGEKQLETVIRCCEEENPYILKEGGILYSNLETTLKELSERCPLFIVSNCHLGYIEAFLEYHRLGQYFTDVESAGKTGLSKGENIRLIIERNHLKHPVYVGDTQGDCNSARQAKVPFIYASYGFGSVLDYDMKIEDVTDLLKIVK